MKSTRLFVVAAIAAFAAAGWLGQVTADQTATPTVGPVAVCDVARAFGRYKKAEDQAKGLNAMLQELEAEMKTRKADLDAMDAELKELSPTSPAFGQTLETLELKAAELKVWQEVQQVRVQSRQRRASSTMYAEVVAAVKAVAVERGFQIVVSQSHEGANASSAELITGHKVLYHSDEVDITDAVVHRLNAQYNPE